MQLKHAQIYPYMFYASCICLHFKHILPSYQHKLLFLINLPLKLNFTGSHFVSSGAYKILIEIPKRNGVWGKLALGILESYLSNFVVHVWFTEAKLCAGVPNVDLHKGINYIILLPSDGLLSISLCMLNIHWNIHCNGIVIVGAWTYAS